VVIALSILIFVLIGVIPGDPARLLLGPRAPEQAVQKLRHEMKLDEPLPVQYLAYVSGVLHGNLGLSLQTRRNVARDVGDFLPATLELAVVSMIFTILIAIPLGVLSASFQGRWIDNVGRFIAIMGVITPAFVAGVFFQLIFAYWLGVLPVVGRLSDSVTVKSVTGFLMLDSLLELDLKAFGDAFVHILLPAFSLALGGIGQITRITRDSILNIRGKEYIETAQAMGIHRFVIDTRFLLKPSFIPTLTILGLTFASLLGNCFLVEMVFSWPGIAKYGINAILRKDTNAIMGVILIIGVAFIVMNFFVDILINMVDPRVRFRGKQ
jgi:peptide/nickel transport system permease protein